MKRFLILALAVVTLGLWTLPAAAAVDFGGQYRIKYERRDYPVFEQGSDNSTSVNDYDSSWGQRVRLWGVANPTDDTTIKITIQDSRYWGDNFKTGGYNTAAGGGPGLTDAGGNNLDLHESYVQIANVFNYPVALRIGRQELNYGDQRLVGSFGWHDNGRSFDAIKAMMSNDTYDLDIWYAKINEAEMDNTIRRWQGADSRKKDEDMDFWGAYATLKNIENHTLDLYLMILRDGGNYYADFGNETLGNENISADKMEEAMYLYTYGARLKGANAGFDYTAEFVFQAGEIATSQQDYDIDAWAYALTGGYTVAGNSMGLRVGAEYLFASGDDDTDDGDIRTFTNLFPTNHGHMGSMDLQAWRNMNAWSLNASVKPNERTFVKVAYWDFELDEAEDGWYGAGDWLTTPGGLRAPTGDDQDLGEEIDITVKYKYNEAVNLEGGVSFFYPGQRIETDTRSDGEDSSWAYFKLTANF
jgi:hypothetical protein